MKTVNQRFDLVVCGGGLAGFCAAVAAARHGLETALVHDRPVLGGNSSSEVRVTPHGAAQFHAYARETGVISEMLIRERRQNHQDIMENGWTNSVWDMVLYDAAMREPRLTLMLNTVVSGVRMKSPLGEPTVPTVQAGFYHRPTLHPDGPGRITAVEADVLNAETHLILEADHFIDATGDGVLADLAGCEWRMGSEGRDAFNETHAPPQGSTDTMGNSIHIRARDMGRPCPFELPQWAVHHQDPSYFYEQGRVPHDPRGGFWWIEIGVPWHTIHDNETIRHELTRHALGIWNWMKNHDPKLKGKIENYALDWIGQTPGKRESRRIMGLRLMTEHDLWPEKPFTDEIAFGGWFVDLHTPGGLLAKSSEPLAAQGYKVEGDQADKSYVGPYGIPLGVMISKDVDNLMMAGRNVSVTHAALGTVRVMATTALMGQAAGTFLALGAGKKKSLKQRAEDAQQCQTVQQTLLRDGCFLPSVANDDPADLARQARVTASSSDSVTGVTLEEVGVHDGLNRWWRPANPERDILTHRRAQWIAIGADRLDAVSVCLSNFDSEPQRVKAVLVPVESIWDYRSSPDAILGEMEFEVPPGGPHWVRHEVGLNRSAGLRPGRYLRLDLMEHKHIAWHASPARFVPGHPSAWAASPRRMRRYHDGATLCFKVEPAQPCFGPEQVISGVARPHRFTNLWRSDPKEKGQSWVELSWEQPQTIGCIEMTFPGHLLREYHAYGPFYTDCQTPRDYIVGAWMDGVWKTVVSEQGNHQRHRRYHLEKPIKTSRLRLIVQATNGDPSAAVHEIRCYA